MEVQNLNHWTAREVPYEAFCAYLLGVSLGVESLYVYIHLADAAKLNQVAEPSSV